MDFFPFCFHHLFLTNPVNASIKAPTYFDDLYKVVSPHEMSPHEIKNLKRFFKTKSSLNHFKNDSWVLITIVTGTRPFTLFQCERWPHELS